MGLFNSRRSEAPPRPEPRTQIPVTPIDLTKRYDVYCTEYYHDRLYQNVRFVGIRTFDRITEFTSGEFLEIEAADGSRWLIPHFGIRLICEHGTEPVFKVLRHRRDSRGG